MDGSHETTTPGASPEPARPRFGHGGRRPGAGRKAKPRAAGVSLRAGAAPAPRSLVLVLEPEDARVLGELAAGLEDAGATIGERRARGPLDALRWLLRRSAT